MEVRGVVRGVVRKGESEERERRERKERRERGGGKGNGIVNAR